MLQVSASQVATVWWHSCIELPFKGIVACRHRLRAENGNMATEDDLRLVRRNQPLGFDDFNKKTLYGLLNEQVRK